MKTLTALLVALTFLALPAIAAAHVELSPSTVEVGEDTLFTVLSPNESEQPLTGLRLEIPDGLVVDAVADTPGFTAAAVEDASHRISALTWQGGSVAPERLALFRFSGSAPASGTLELTGIQRFADGSTRIWHTAELTVGGGSSGSSNSDSLAVALAVVALIVAVGSAAVFGFVLLRGRRAAV